MASSSLPSRPSPLGPGRGPSGSVHMIEVHPATRVTSPTTLSDRSWATNTKLVSTRTEHVLTSRSQAVGVSLRTVSAPLVRVIPATFRVMLQPAPGGPYDRVIP